MLAILGGTGVYQLEGLERIESVAVSTPYGEPSAAIRIGWLQGKRVAFLPRHGERHELLPGEIPARANLWALKSLGAEAVLGISAVGSLKEALKPGDFVLPDQYLDQTRGLRPSTFFGRGLVAHISSAEPTCRTLARLAHEALSARAATVHERGTYVCIEGPRLGNRAESALYRSWGADVVGMTNVPEVYLAREAQLRYCTIGVITDYDCWQEDPNLHVSAEAIFPLYRKSLETVRAALLDLVAHYEPASSSPARHALEGALLTKPDQFSTEQRALWELLSR